MNDKVGWTAAALAGVLLFGAGLGFLGGMAANAPEPDAEPSPDVETEDPDAAPLLSMDDAVHPYAVTAFTVSGLVADEDPISVTVEVEMVDPLDETIRHGPFTFFTGADGRWSGVLPITQPAEWVLIAIAIDDGGQRSSVVYGSAVMTTPDEPEATLEITFTGPDSGEEIARLNGTLTHPFPQTCSVAFLPQGQAELPAVLNGSAFHIEFDYNSTSAQGDLIADCGLFTETRADLTYAIPRLFVDDDADQDGFPDEEDACDDTPTGEPVHPDGCSDSQRDGDGDGIVDSEDRCPGQDDTVDVDNDGTPDGCDDLVDSDGDGVADEADDCDGGDDNADFDGDGIPDDCDFDADGDGVANGNDDCPSTPAGTEVDANGCELDPFDPVDSWLCTDGQGPWVRDWNEEYYGSQRANDNGVASAGGSGTGPWFQCQVSVSVQGEDMVVDSNGIPNHDFLSTRGCCTDESDHTATIPLNPVNDTGGGHSSTNCPAAAGRWECAPDRGAVAISVTGVPIFGPEEGPGGDAVALHFSYFDEDRQPIELGWCTGHAAGPTFHYHYDANCIYWTPDAGEDMSDYDPSNIDGGVHSPIIGWAFDGYPIYGMYGYDDDGQSIRAITSSYAVERTQEGGDQGYNGIDDWNYQAGVGDLDECNGRFGPTPEYPEGIYHYVSTPLSGSPTMVTDTEGAQVGMIGFPYFLLCYHGVADVDAQSLGGGQGPPPRSADGGAYVFMPENIDWTPPPLPQMTSPSLLQALEGLVLLTVVWVAWTQRDRWVQAQF